MNVRYLYLIIFLPSFCFAWDGTGTPLNVVRNSTEACHGELASRLSGTGFVSNDPWLYLEGDVCLSPGAVDYNDFYKAVELSRCDDNAQFRLDAQGRCWPSDPQYGGVLTDGYCCAQYPFFPCLPGVKAFTCEELINYNRQFVPEIQVSYERYYEKAYYGEKTYRGVNSPGYRVVYRLYGEDDCDDTYELKRFNDVVSVENYNNETYQFYSKRRGVESSLPLVDLALLQPVQTWNEYISQGTLAAPFKRKDIIEQHGGGGFYRLDAVIVGTRCGIREYKIIVEPEPWYDCNAGPGSYCYCINDDGSCCGLYSWMGDTYLGWDTNYRVNGPYGNLYYYWLDPYEYVSWELWRYPVDKKFKATGPLELVTSIVTGFPDWGYITAPGGDDTETDFLLEKGYKYRFRFDMGGFLWSYDIGGWPCPVSEVKGTPTPIQGGISRTDGNNYMMPNPIFKGLQWKK